MLIGATDTEGRFEIEVPDGDESALRFVSYGHLPVDAHSTWIMGDMFASALHPGAFSGFLPGSRDALWVGLDEKEAIQFSAFGYFRRASTLKELKDTVWNQYRLQQRFSWLPDTEPDPKGGHWSPLGTRSGRFPSNRRWTQLLSGWQMFRFPAPARMIAKDPSSGKTKEFKLYA